MADTLAAWSPTSNLQLTTLDFGSSPAGSSADLTFRVRNMSTLYTAQGVTVGLTGTDATQCYVSADGLTFIATVTLGDLLPSAVSGLLYLRRVTPTGSSTGAKTCNLHLQAASWVGV